MLTKLHIDNLKCFKQLSLSLAPLTLLTGFNAAGKSTAIQSLLLLAQACRSQESKWQIGLNGDLTQLGTPGEALHEGVDDDLILGFESGDARLAWVLKAEKKNQAHAMRISQIDWQSGALHGRFIPNLNPRHSLGLDTLTPDFDKFAPRTSTLNQLIPSDADAQMRESAKVGESDAIRLLWQPIKAITNSIADSIFLSAVRSGADDVYPIPTLSEPIVADVGVRGEFAAWLLQQLSDEDIDIDRCHPAEPTQILRRQFNAWAGELFPGVQINSNRIPGTQLIQLSWRNHEADNWRRPSNIGYGLTYVLPIIIAGLLAKKGQILIIDSPEAHIHPMGQSAMGRFLAMVANAGVQVIIETHSDHILNGVRLAVFNGRLSAQNAAIHFFNSRPRGSDNHAHVLSPQIDKNGNLSEWPVGFFDQAETDLAKLAGWAA